MIGGREKAHTNHIGSAVSFEVTIMFSCVQPIGDAQDLTRRLILFLNIYN